ncbi:MAG TPA: methionyl-tRNA formyltransferase [Steroidobacteraceae bacterium]|nr:methionyl-tRNA formyltransferase [Steroidobacteraceae bacterium]
MISAPPLKLGFAGTPDFAVPALESLAGRHRIAAVFTQPDRPAGRGQALHLSPVKRRALELGLTVHQPASFKTPDALEMLRAAQVDVLVVVAYGLILPAAVLVVPARGCLNIHASLLPRWRGAAPIQRALLAGDSVTGVTIMRMEAGLDTGPMLLSRAITIDSRDNAKSLHDKLAHLGALLIEESLQALRLGSQPEVAQPLEGITYAAKIDKAETPIQWGRHAEEISRQVRAFNPTPVAETRFDGKQLRIWEAEPLDAPALSGPSRPPGSVLTATREGIDVVCGTGVLRILKLQLAGRKPLPAEEFLRGQRLDGTRFSNP